MAKIILENSKCIGCGSCETVCPKYWKLGDNGKIELLGSKRKGDDFELELKEVGCNKEAVESCPVQCIKIQN